MHLLLSLHLPRTCYLAQSSIQGTEISVVANVMQGASRGTERPARGGQLSGGDIAFGGNGLTQAAESGGALADIGGISLQATGKATNYAGASAGYEAGAGYVAAQHVNDVQVEPNRWPRDLDGSNLDREPHGKRQGVEHLRDRQGKDLPLDLDGSNVDGKPRGKRQGGGELVRDRHGKRPRSSVRDLDLSA